MYMGGNIPSSDLIFDLCVNYISERMLAHRAYQRIKKGKYPIVMIIIIMGIDL
jgi:hypothetical protein